MSFPNPSWRCWRKLKEVVSILVLVDVLPEPFSGNRFRLRVESVSILVLVDVLPEPAYVNTALRIARVSILVLVDVLPEPGVSGEGSAPIGRFQSLF